MWQMLLSFDAYLCCTITRETLDTHIRLAFHLCTITSPQLPRIVFTSRPETVRPTHTHTYTITQQTRGLASRQVRVFARELGALSDLCHVHFPPRKSIHTVWLNTIRACTTFAVWVHAYLSQPGLRTHAHNADDRGRGPC